MMELMVTTSDAEGLVKGIPPAFPPSLLREGIPAGKLPDVECGPWRLLSEVQKTICFPHDLMRLTPPLSGR